MIADDLEEETKLEASDVNERGGEAADDGDQESFVMNLTRNLVGSAVKSVNEKKKEILLQSKDDASRVSTTVTTQI